ncbi:MAG: purine-nucleoside phosphorylase [Paracoccaceae bacterium]
MRQVERVERAVASIAERAGAEVELALILGSGLGRIARCVMRPSVIPYGEIEGFPVSSAPGHSGRLLIGELFGRRVAVMDGRLHLYEGWTAREVALPVYLFKRLGARALIVTNAAGALDETYAPGEAMVIADHINLTGRNPLIGENDETLGLRFPDMSRAYAPELCAGLHAAAAKAQVSLREGIYAGITGPSLETSAERRFLRASGADAVGMSTVTEVIAANHAGLRVAAMSAITNKATGGSDQQPDTIEEVLKHAATAGQVMQRVLEHFMPALEV